MFYYVLRVRRPKFHSVTEVQLDLRAAAATAHGGKGPGIVGYKS